MIIWILRNEIQIIQHPFRCEKTEKYYLMMTLKKQKEQQPGENELDTKQQYLEQYWISLMIVSTVSTIDHSLESKQLIQ